MSFSSFNYRITSSLSARSAVDPEQWWTHLKRILECKDLQLIIIVTWPTPLTSTSPTTSSPPSPSYNNTNSWSNRLKDSWTMTPTSWSKERAMPPFTTSFSLMPPIRNRTPSSLEPHRQDSPPTPDPHCEAHYHCKMCAHCCIQLEEKDCPRPQQWPRPSHWTSSLYHFLTL